MIKLKPPNKVMQRIHDYCLGWREDPPLCPIGEEMSEDLKPMSVKAPMHLLPARPLRAVVAAIEHGALKYKPWNWQDTSKNEQRISELMAALMRHVTAAADPVETDYDDESGLHHIAHAGACVLILLHKMGVDYVPSKLKSAPIACDKKFKNLETGSGVPAGGMAKDMSFKEVGEAIDVLYDALKDMLE